VSVVVSIVLFLVIVGGLIALGVRALRRRPADGEEGGLDLIPYLILALAVGIGGFSLARLARASLTPDRFAGRPTGELAAALAGLVVAGPVAYLLWRRQSRRRKAFPRNPGWPIYLGAVEFVFLTAFLVAVGQVTDALTSNALTPEWPDLVVYGGIVAFHWWSERKEPPWGDAGELPRLIGSAVAVIALTTGAIGTLTWLLSEAYEGLGGAIDVTDPAVFLALTLVAAPIWAWRWLPAFPDDDPSIFRSLYLSALTATALVITVAAGVTMTSVLVSYLLGQAGRVEDHFRIYPPALAFLIVGSALWIHHRRRLGTGRTGAVRGYEYVMAATGLAGLIGTAVALVNIVFEQRLAGSNAGEAVIALGSAVIAGGWVWTWFWRKIQTAPRDQETRALQRRMYLIGMSVVTGLTAAGGLIGSLVVVFRAVLGEGGEIADSLRLPLTLTVLSGLAAWHLFTQLRTDNASRERTEARPFVVTIICSHPGPLASSFPGQATTRILYRADTAGIVSDEMAAAIVAAVGTTSSLVWVDDAGFRVAPAREA